MQFLDRSEAGHRLAQALMPYREGAVVYALPRGGVTLGAEVATELQIPMDLLMVHRLSHPNNSEYAVGAVADDDEPVLSPKAAVDGETWLPGTLHAARLENARRSRTYFYAGYVPPVVEGGVAILVDDGIATGLTMQAAARAVQKRNPSRIVAAAPVASAGALVQLLELVDDIVILDRPSDFLGSVGQHYLYFPEVTDREVAAALAEASHVPIKLG